MDRTEISIEHISANTTQQTSYVNPSPTKEGRKAIGGIQMVAKSGKAASKNSTTNATPEKKFFLTVKAVNNTSGTLVMDPDFLTGFDKDVVKDIAKTVGLFNKAGTTFSCRVYDVFPEEERTFEGGIEIKKPTGRIYALISKYSLRINKTPVENTDVAAAIQSGRIRAYLTGVKADHYDKGIIISGEVKKFVADGEKYKMDRISRVAHKVVAI